MIDMAMLSRLMIQTGFIPPEIPNPRPTAEMLTLAKAIWAAAQTEELKVCSEICDNDQAKVPGGFLPGHA